MRGRGDRDLLLREVVPRPHERQRLQGFRRRAQVRDEGSLPGLGDERPVAHSDAVDEVARLDHTAPARLDGDRFHGASVTCEWSVNVVCSALIDRFVSLPVSDYEADDVLVVTDPADLRALADDFRMKIVSVLRERAASTSELAEQLGAPKGTVGHHLKVLQRAGLVRVVRTRKVRAVTEKYYGRTARLFIFKSADAPPDVESTSALAAAGLRQAATEVGPGAADPERATFALVHGRLQHDDVRRFVRRLERLVAEFGAAEGEDGDEFALVVGLYPTETGRA
jgi:DNA-binding transcriptional ArsR family regulator